MQPATFRRGSHTYGAYFSLIGVAACVCAALPKGAMAQPSRDNAVIVEGAYPPPPSGALMLTEPVPPLPTWRVVAAPAMIAIGLGSIVGSLMLRSAAKDRGREIDLAQAGFGGMWPRELKEERQRQVDEVDSLQAEKDRNEKLFQPLLWGGAVVLLIGSLLLLRRPTQSEFRVSLNRASLGGQF